MIVNWPILTRGLKVCGRLCGDEKPWVLHIKDVTCYSLTQCQWFRTHSFSVYFMSMPILPRPPERHSFATTACLRAACLAEEGSLI